MAKNPINYSKYNKTSNGIYYVDTYHPWHGGNNPLWNDFSAKTLDLKNGKIIGINYFFSKIIERGLYQTDFTIVTVPPSDPAKSSIHGTRLLVETIFKTCCDVKFRNGTDCLVRTNKVAKSVSGDRSIKKHLDSIEVQHLELIINRTVLLIDDVTTTGNSLKACEAILKKANCEQIVLLALAHTA